jgi:hypothetical protein
MKLTHPFIFYLRSGPQTKKRRPGLRPIFAPAGVSETEQAIAEHAAAIASLQKAVARLPINRRTAMFIPEWEVCYDGCEVTYYCWRQEFAGLKAQGNPAQSGKLGKT